MENKGAAPAAAAAQENKEDATFVEAAREQLKQFTEAPMEQHWACIKNQVRSVFGDFGDFAGPGKDDKTPSVESQ